MLVTTSETIAGHRVVQTFGEVFGLVVRSRGLIPNIFATIRSLFGGEIHEYTSLLEDARLQAVERLKDNASGMGANAVIMMRFDASEIGQAMSEIVAYGTAVTIESVDGAHFGKRE
jgi:uncharacterized protein YbjQ (UPF0145 family)